VKRFSRTGAAVLALTTLLTLVFVSSSAGHRSPVYSPSGKSKKFHSGDAGSARTKKAILFAADGMRPDLVERYADKRIMPTFRELLKDGVSGDNGLLQGFPPNTGVGWHTLATGTWPGEHGSTNNTFHRTGAAFDTTTSFATTGILQADTLLQSAERAGKTVVAMEWVAARGLVPAIQGPVIDFRTFIGGRGIVLNFDLPGQPALANSFGVQYQRQTLADAPLAPAVGGWSNVPNSFSPPKQTTFTHGNSQIPGGGVWDVFIYDSTNNGSVNYDRVLIVNTADNKNGNEAVADIGRNQWADAKLTLASGGLAGRTAGFYTKLIDLNNDASRFRLYFTSVQRVNASYNALGPTGSEDFAETLARDFPTSTAADFAPLEALIVDEDTYVEQGLMWADAHFGYLNYIFKELDVDADMLFLGTPITDEFQHQFAGLLVPKDIDGRANPYYDNVDGMGSKDRRLDEREDYIRAAYHEADETLALGRKLMGKKDTTVMASSDHGFAPQWLAINARQILFDTTVTSTTSPPVTYSLHPSGNPAATFPAPPAGPGGTPLSNCRAQPLPAPPVGSAPPELAKACWAGGTVQVYVNQTLPPGVTYEAVRTAVRNAFANLTDPGAANRPSSTNAQVIQRIMNKEELRNVDGTDSLHPNRSGDVVVVSRPPYQFDAATLGQRIAFSQFFGQHGYLPNLVNLKRDVNMHGTFVASGPGIRDRSDVKGVRAIDVAPTLAFLMGIPGPQNARGKIRFDILTKTDDLRELTILNISDYHGQIVPLLDAADTAAVAPATPPQFAIGGSAFLKPWFDIYRKEARDGHITTAAGDTIGATPPISAFFEDRPAIEMMNRMGVGADGIGNHNFDVNEAFFRGTIVPLANFPFLSANVVDAAGNTPAEWRPSKLFRFGRDLDLALIGFTNDDVPLLTRPGSLGPFHIANSTDSVNAEIGEYLDRRGKRERAEIIVAMGHLGATAGTLTAPTGPAVDLADAPGINRLDAVLADHTDQQVVSHRTNGVLLTENRSKGLRFTRVRLVADTDDNKVVYKTADFHRPWNIGVTPDPAIQARLDELQAALNPILGQSIGSSSRAIPRSDQCGRADGRLCESLVGNLVTDAMRKTYLTDFAITNSGGLRADMTCPNPDIGGDFCTAFTPPPWPITRGQALAVLPFGNIIATLSLNGAELKTMLENGVSQMPGANGRFPQVSGLCFTYDIQLPANGRVTGAVRQAEDGSCTATPVDLTAASTYSLAENDFMSDGGDGYPVFRPRITTREIMDQAVADYITANSPLAPAIQGRINCADSMPAVPPACPAITSP
jgi:2',3'-cyclic-nucleotide 2'-phosphodiesterase (5'-nucleotidase family)